MREVVGARGDNPRRSIDIIIGNVAVFAMRCEKGREFVEPKAEKIGSVME